MSKEVLTFMPMWISYVFFFGGILALIVTLFIPTKHTNQKKSRDNKEDLEIKQKISSFSNNETINQNLNIENIQRKIEDDLHLKEEIAKEKLSELLKNVDYLEKIPNKILDLLLEINRLNKSIDNLYNIITILIIIMLILVVMSIICLNIKF